MRLGVFHTYYDPEKGVNHYDVAVHDHENGPIGPRSMEDPVRLGALSNRIEAMGRHILGENFIGITNSTNLSGSLTMRVKKRTAKDPETKFKWRNFVGWLALFADEPGAQ